MFLVSLLLQLMDENRTALPPWAIIAGIALCFAVAYYAIKKGKNLPRYVGLAGVGLHGVVTTFVLGTAPFLVKATANLQEMPLMAMYLAWFYPKKTACWSLVVYVAGVLGFASIGHGRYLSESGSTHEIVRLILFMTLCMELGFLWRGRVRAEGQVDLLTGAISREGFSARALRELDRARRNGFPISLAVIDLDGFKTVNDEHGHAAGDRVLKNVVNEIRANIRSSDAIFRIGGDEFVLLLPHTNEESASGTLERLRATSSHPWSWGVAEMAAHDTPESMVMRADKSMYKDKRRR